VTTRPPTRDPTTEPPTLDACDNGYIDGSETDTDCGGYECPRCEEGWRCAYGGRDCLSGLCERDSGRCVSETGSPTPFPTEGTERISVYHWDGRMTFQLHVVVAAHSLNLALPRATESPELALSSLGLPTLHFLLCNTRSM